MTAPLYQQWLNAKAIEAKATATRRDIEDELVASLSVNVALDKVQTYDCDEYTVKVTGRLDRKVDADLLQEVAAEHGLTNHLPMLFRWKPEVNMAAWKATPADVTGPLSAAITTKPGRPSFAITKHEGTEHG